jgi:hypothetical protein
MKKIQLSVVALLLLSAVACQKSGYIDRGGIGVNGNVSNSEAADMVSASLASSSDGVANIADDVTQSAASLATSHVSCGTVKSDSVSRQSAAGAINTYSYKSTYLYKVICDGSSQPDSLSSSLIYSGSFSGPNLSSTNSGSSIFKVAGLPSTTTNYVINGEYKSAGSFKSKVDTTNTGSSNIDIAIQALTLAKQTRTIASGNANITVTGSVPKKGSFSYTGTLVFNGNHTATLTLNGTVYTINLVNGQKTKQ